MAFYTQNVKTEIFNSVFDQANYRSEFRLDSDKLYLSNMRILNLGLTAAELGDGRYNLVNGVGSIIKNIYLYDNSVILDKVINFADYSAFQSYNKSNQHNSDISKLLARNGLGFVYEREPNAQDAASNPILIRETFPNAPHKPQILQEDTAMGFLNLQSVFPLLKGAGGLQFIHTGLFKNLRVVIEYNVKGSVVEAVPVLEKTTLPILVADCVDDGGAAAAKYLSSFKGVTWISNELETVNLPAPSVPELAAKTQSLKMRLTGSLGKTVNYMLIQSKGPVDASELYGNHGSETMINASFQIFCNGSSILPEAGISKPNERLALLHDTFGVCNSHSCSNELPVYDAASIVDNEAARCGRLDYFGCVINKKITALDLAYSRSVSADATVDGRYSQPLTFNVFYGILKAIVLEPKGGYSVIYV